MESPTKFYARYYGELLQRSSMSLAKGVALPFVRGEAVRSGAHAMGYPISTYAPWQSEAEFKRVYRTIKRKTLVDIWRCHELWSLLGELRESPGAVVEVGVWRGGTGALTAARIEALGQTERVYLCDTWRGVVKTGPTDIYYRDGKHDDTSKQIVEALVQRMGLRNVVLLQGIFPEDTGPTRSRTSSYDWSTSMSTSTSRPRTCSSGRGHGCRPAGSRCSTITDSRPVRA